MSMCRSASSTRGAVATLLRLQPLPGDRSRGRCPSRVEQLDALADQRLRRDAAERGEREQPVLLDVRHRDPDLVDVTDERERRRAVGTASAPARTTCRACRTSPRRTPTAASRQTRAGSSSCPDGPGASEATAEGREGPSACAFKQERLRWPAMSSATLTLLGLAPRAGREPALGSVEPRRTHNPPLLDPDDP